MLGCDSGGRRATVPAGGAAARDVVWADVGPRVQVLYGEAEYGNVWADLRKILVGLYEIRVICKN